LHPPAFSPANGSATATARRQSVDAGAQVVYDDAGALRQLFKAANGRGFYDIERTKEYKAAQQRFPKNGAGDQRNQLSGNLIDDHVLRIFLAATAGFQRGGRYAYGDDRRDQEQDCRDLSRRRKRRRDEPPQHYRG